MEEQITRDYQNRKYFLTINKPNDSGYTHAFIIEALKDMNITYFCLSDEVGNETHTYHTHVYLYSPSPIRFSTIKKKFMKAHIEKALGSCIDNRNYIKKEGKWADTDKSETVVEGTFEEYGVMPSERAEKEPDMAKIISMFDEGSSINDVINLMPKYGLRVNELENLYNLRKLNNSEKLRKVNVTYIFGDTGTGKTYSIYKKYAPEEVCRITNYCDKGIFDSYHGQKILVFDEFHSQISMPQMLTYLDVYPVRLPARYHDRQAIYTDVYILSNIPLDKQYERERLSDIKTWKAFERRIGRIYQQIGFDSKLEIKKGGVDYDENPFTSKRNTHC